MCLIHLASGIDDPLVPVQLHVPAYSTSLLYT